MATHQNSISIWAHRQTSCPLRNETAYRADAQGMIGVILVAVPQQDIGVHQVSHSPRGGSVHVLAPQCLQRNAGPFDGSSFKPRMTPQDAALSPRRRASVLAACIRNPTAR